MKNFSELELKPSLQRALQEIDYTTMTPVQAESLPPILAGRDVLAQAKTGSGKTAAFALGLLSVLDPSDVRLQGLVLCPTRELADQVSREIRRLARFIPNVKVLTLFGGVPLRHQLASLAHEPHIVVGTPGRVLDLLKRRALKLGAVRMFVLDEADRMLDMGFADAMRDVARRLPAKHQALLFSATIPDAIREVSHEFQDDAVHVSIDDEKETPIEQSFMEVEPERKTDVLAALLSAQQPASAVVFCNFRDDVRRLRDDLHARGISALALHGELEQRQREEMLVQFANGSCRVLVASDVAARGLDISGLPLVVNFNVANDPETHVHRIGRTGRAGQPGRAITLVSGREKARARTIEERLGEPLTWSRPPADQNTAMLAAPFITLAIDAGRQDKLRPGDVLGALTGDAGIPGDAVGRIDIFPTRTYVAIRNDWADRAAKRLRAGRIKARRYRIMRITRD